MPLTALERLRCISWSFSQTYCLCNIMVTNGKGTSSFEVPTTSHYSTLPLYSHDSPYWTLWFYRLYCVDIHRPKLFKPNDFTIPSHCLHSKFSRILTNLSTSGRVASKMFCTDMFGQSVRVLLNPWPFLKPMTWHDMIWFYYFDLCLYTWIITFPCASDALWV